MSPQRLHTMIASIKADPIVSFLARSVYGQLNAVGALDHNIHTVLTTRRAGRDPLKSSRRILAVSRRLLAQARKGDDVAPRRVTDLETQITRFEAKLKLVKHISAMLRVSER